jgi:hypothetical protein
VVKSEIEARSPTERVREIINADKETDAAGNIDKTEKEESTEATAS